MAGKRVTDCERRLASSGTRLMKGDAVMQTRDRVRRVSVTDPIAAGRRYDYADAFELRLDEPDPCSPEAWVRAGIDATPAWIKRIAGHRGEGLGSARIVRSDAEVVWLEDSDPLMDTMMVGRNIEPDRRVLTTVLRYRRPLLTRAIWALVGILHRRTARRVVAAGRRQRERRGDAVVTQDDPDARSPDLGLLGAATCSTATTSSTRPWPRTRPPRSGQTGRGAGRTALRSRRMRKADAGP